MSSDIIVDILVASLAFFSLFISIFAYLISKKQMFYPAIVYLQNEYRTPEMFEALHGLWELYDDVAKELGFTNKKIGSDLTKQEKQKFEKRIKSRYRERYEDEKFTSIPIEDTLDYKRRIVSHFFRHLDTLREIKILKLKHIRTICSDDTAFLLENVSIPLEEELVDIIYKDRPWVDPKDILYYKDIATRSLNNIIIIVRHKMSDCLLQIFIRFKKVIN